MLATSIPQGGASDELCFDEDEILAMLPRGEYFGATPGAESTLSRSSSPLELNLLSDPQNPSLPLDERSVLLRRPEDASEHLSVSADHFEGLLRTSSAGSGSVTEELGPLEFTMGELEAEAFFPLQSGVGSPSSHSLLSNGGSGCDHVGGSYEGEAASAGARGEAIKPLAAHKQAARPPNGARGGPTKQSVAHDQVARPLARRPLDLHELVVLHQAVIRTPHAEESPIKLFACLSARDENRGKLSPAKDFAEGVRQRVLNEEATARLVYADDKSHVVEKRERKGVLVGRQEENWKAKINDTGSFDFLQRIKVQELSSEHGDRAFCLEVSVPGFDPIYTTPIYTTTKGTTAQAKAKKQGAKAASDQRAPARMSPAPAAPPAQSAPSAALPLPTALPPQATQAAMNLSSAHDMLFARLNPQPAPLSPKEKAAPTPLLASSSSSSAHPSSSTASTSPSPSTTATLPGSPLASERTSLSASSSTSSCLSAASSSSPRFSPPLPSTLAPPTIDDCLRQLLAPDRSFQELQQSLLHIGSKPASNQVRALV